MRRRLSINISVAFAVVFSCSIFQLQGKDRPSQGATCEQPKGTAAISFVDSPRSPSTIRTARGVGDARAQEPVFIRNDGSTSLNQWCVNIDFADYQDRRIIPEFSITLVQDSATFSTSQTRDNELCFTAKVAPGSVFGINVLFTILPERLPLSGTLTVTATGQSREALETAKQQHGQKDTTTAQCVIAAKEITRTVVLSAASNGAYSTLVVCTSGLGALAFWCIAIAVFWGGLKSAMGGAQWDFTTSWATHVTVGGGILGIIFAASLLPDYPHFMTKQAYMTINLLFSVLIALAPTIYNLTCGPTSPDASGAISYKGTVLFFLIAAAVTMWAVVGQLLTAGFLFGEFVIRGYVTVPSVIVFFIVLTLVGLALGVFCWRNTRFYAPPPPQKGKVRVERVAEGVVARPLPRWKAF